MLTPYILLSKSHNPKFFTPNLSFFCVSYDRFFFLLTFSPPTTPVPSMTSKPSQFSLCFKNRKTFSLNHLHVVELKVYRMSKAGTINISDMYPYWLETLLFKMVKSHVLLVRNMFHVKNNLLIKYSCDLISQF